ncbi:MAG: O-antigen ligase family protein [Anaerolineales bacterium]|nr:O-antigen ligase family protein [Anaerolineales bacterium]
MKTAVNPTSSSSFNHSTWNQVVYSRWFALAELGCIVVAAGLWYISQGQLAGWPLLLALLPWAVHLASRQSPWHHTPLDYGLVLFLLTAVLALTTPYDPTTASNKWWLVIGAILLYGALSHQPASNRWLIIIGLGGTAVAVALYFLLSHDWQTMPAKIEMLNRWATRWMALRPALAAHQLHPNVAAGLMAMLAPFWLASSLRAWRQRHWALLAAAASLPILGLSLLFTTSRGAWLALIGGLLTWGIWSLSQRFCTRLYLSARQTFALGLFVLLGLSLSTALLYPTGPLAILNSLPGPAQAGNRLAIARQTWDLVGDFFFTGAGLGSFPALYATYIHGVPFHLLIHSHNLFLDVALEQGVFGLLALLFILSFTFWQLTQPAANGQVNVRDSLITGATLASLTVLLLHGLVEDPLYGSRGLLLLLLHAGLVAPLVQPGQSKFWHRLRHDWVWQWAAATLLLVIVLSLFSYRRHIQASWQANRAVVALAQLELADFPTGEWQTVAELPDYQPVIARLQQAAQLDSANRTANYHLGRLALLQQDFATAVFYLERAYKTDPNHRGIRKALGYSYLWSGQLNKSFPLLATLAEVPGELDTYPWWWQSQNRDDLATLAQQMRDAVANNHSSSTP